jgi:hypothetical protein
VQDRFAATILAEEETAQQVLSLKREKAKAHKELMLAKIRAETDIQLAHSKAKDERKREKQAVKLDLMRLRMEHEHQLKMAQIQAQVGPSSMALSGSSSSSHVGSPYSFDGLQLPSSFSGDFDGPSTYTNYVSFLLCLIVALKASCPNLVYGFPFLDALAHKLSIDDAVLQGSFAFAARRHSLCSHDQGPKDLNVAGDCAQKLFYMPKSRSSTRLAPSEGP